MATILIFTSKIYILVFPLLTKIWSEHLALKKLT